MSNQEVDDEKEVLLKHLETLSWEEMSKRIADSRHEVSHLLGVSIDNINNNEPEDSSILFNRAVHSGNILKLKEMLSDPEIDPYIINAGDRDVGWTALMWAATNHHESIVQLLLNNGASLETKSVKGRTVFDFIGADDQKMVDLLVTDSRDSMSSNASSSFSRTLSSSSSCSSYDFDLCEQDEQDCTFQWDKCSPDQMFVFNQDDLQYILDSIIVHFQLPLNSRDDMYIPANIIFLSIRYSFYYSTEPSFEIIIEGVLDRIRMLINPNDPDIHLLAFWIVNLTQLLFYLKKDNGLVLATVEQQFQLSELVSELYTALIRDTEQRIVHILNLALLDHDFIPDMEQVQFADSWQRYEVNEPRIPDEIEKYTMQCVLDKVRQQSGEANNHRTSIYGRSSLSYFTRPSEPLCLEESKEMLNTKIMLPFSLPSLSEMDNEHQALPSLPEEWIYKLDRQQEES
ncbi:hypothetical protein RMCBS344292_14695 [Rhizopus microsporus]|nr:hypothetical protein RMCBS344292_14695 [Rhizopus microsporus]